MSRLVRRRAAVTIPFSGWPECRTSAPLVESLSDDDLERLNAMLEWQCFTVDARGRRFGNAAWSGKRTTPQEIPDPRILRFDERFGLNGRSVLEIGCFEGVHTIGLAQRGAAVHATDARVENVVKTMVRCSWYGVAAQFGVWDVEQKPSRAHLFGCDLVHHVGVLYHLADPVSHLRDIGAVAGTGLMLDTHVAPSDAPMRAYDVDGQTYRYMRYGEHGRGDPFSGMQNHAKWLLLDDLVAVLGEAGFDRVDVLEQRAERNGPRVLLFASKPGR